MNRRVRMERELVTTQSDEFGDAQTGGKSQMQHGPIARAAASVGIGRIEQCLHFCVCEIVDECLVRSFDRDSFDATDLIEAAGQAILQEAEEGFDGTEPGISSLRQIVTL